MHEHFLKCADLLAHQSLEGRIIYYSILGSIAQQSTLP